MVFIALFWLFFCLIIYSYGIYPVLIQILARHKTLNFSFYTKQDVLPRIAIMMSVLNEAQVIEEKIKTILKCPYPADKITLWIGSDGSTDDTNVIIKKYEKQSSLIHFFPFIERKGKTSVLNKLYLELISSQPDILIFTDANVLFDENLLFEIVKYFKDTRVGQVAANVHNTIPDKRGIAEQEKTYIQRENMIKYNEGVLWGAMQGAFGACYAIRTALYATFPAYFITDDFFISMNVLKHKYKAILNPDALCYEDVSVNAQDEYRRKSRISAGNYINLALYRKMLLNPFTVVGFAFISHKLIRWFAPVLLVIMPLCCLAVRNKFYLGLFIVQVFMMLTPIWDKLLNAVHIKISVLRLTSYFYYMNLALLNGLIQYAKGVKTHVWTPTPRNV